MFAETGAASGCIPLPSPPMSSIEADIEALRAENEAIAQHMPAESAVLEVSKVCVERFPYMCLNGMCRTFARVSCGFQ